MKINIEDNPFIMSALEIKFNEEVKPLLIEAGFGSYPLFNPDTEWFNFLNKLKLMSFKNYDEALQVGFKEIDKKVEILHNPYAAENFIMSNWTDKDIKSIMEGLNCSATQTVYEQ